MAAPTASSRSRTSSSRSSARSPTSTTRTTRRGVVRQPDGSFLADARANLEDVDRDRRPGIRSRRRGGQGGRHARRLYRDPHRPRAGARRARARPRPLRDRGARRRSPPRQEAEDLREPATSQPRPRSAAARDGARPATAALRPAPADAVRTSRHPRRVGEALARRRRPRRLRANREARTHRPFDHAGLGLAARADRVRRPAPSPRWRCRRSTSGRCRS